MLEVKDLEVYYGAIHAVKGHQSACRRWADCDPHWVKRCWQVDDAPYDFGPHQTPFRQHPFDGTDITGTPAHKIVASGLVQVPEGRHVFANMSVMENLDMGAYLRKDKDGIEKDKKKVFELFPAF